MSEYMAQKMDDQIEYAQRTYDEMCEEIDRLERELAERETQLASIRQLLEDAEARAVIPDGWVAVERMETPKKFCEFSHDNELDFLEKKAYSEGWNDCLHSMLSARPELPTKGSDKLDLAIVSARGDKAMPPQFGSGIFAHPNPYDESDHE